MAGTDFKIADAQTMAAPSLPLYLAGLIIAGCGIVAVNAALPTPDDGWMARTLLLAGVGFSFSFGSRRLAISPALLDFGFAAFALLLLAGGVTGQLALEQFLPLGADKPDLRLLSALACLSTLWAWALRSDNRVMGTTVPAMATLGLAATVDLNDPVLVCFGVFIVTVIFLLIHQNFLQNRARAGVGARQQPESRLLPAEFAQAGLCALGVLLAGLLVIIPAQALFARLSLAQAIRHLAAIGPRPPLAGNAALHFSDDDTLAIGTGDAWSASAEVVMRVTPSDGQEHYWRGRTYDLYTGEGWQSSLENQKDTIIEGSPADDNPAHLGYAVRPDLTYGDPPAQSVSSPLTATFKVLGDTGQFYYAAAPRQIVLNTNFVRNGRIPQECRDGRLDLADQGAVRFPYAVVSEPAPDATHPDVQARLRRLGTDYPPDVRRLYLEAKDNGVTQPEDTAFYRQAVAEALQDLPPARRDPLDEALAIRAWVSNRCVYSLAVPPIPTEADHVHAFLGDTRSGYCDMFASSMAVLCRTAGIPARLATGFAPGDPDGDSFNLRGEDKHAWTEVYFPKTGWVAFDATAGSRTDGSVPSARGNPTGGWLARLRGGLGAAGKFVWIGLTVIALILGYVLKTEVYDPRRARRRAAMPNAVPADAPRTALGRQYVRLSRALARLGLPRRPSETPGEYAARAVPFLLSQQRELGLPLPPSLVTGLTGTFTAACYGASIPAANGAEEWERGLARLEAAARVARWRRFWQRKPRRALSQQ